MRGGTQDQRLPGPLLSLIRRYSEWAETDAEGARWIRDAVSTRQQRDRERTEAIEVSKADP